MISFSTANTGGLPVRNPLAESRVKDGTHSPFEFYGSRLFQSVWNPRMCLTELTPQSPGTAAAMLESLSEDETCGRWFLPVPFFRSGS